jgi:hypothetical protein
MRKSLLALIVLLPLLLPAILHARVPVFYVIGGTVGSLNTMQSADIDKFMNEDGYLMVGDFEWGASLKAGYKTLGQIEFRPCWSKYSHINETEWDGDQFTILSYTPLDFKSYQTIFKINPISLMAPRSNHGLNLCCGFGNHTMTDSEGDGWTKGNTRSFGAEYFYLTSNKNGITSSFNFTLESEQIKYTNFRLVGINHPINQKQNTFKFLLGLNFGYDFKHE